MKARQRKQGRVGNRGEWLLIGLVLELLLFVSSARALPSPICHELDFVGSWPFGPSLTVAVDEARSLAFMAGGGAVYVIDISDPANMVTLSTIRTPGAASSHGTRNLFYKNNFLYIANGHAGLQIWNVSNPNAPSRSGRYTFGSAVAKGVYVYGSYAYVAAKTGLYVINVSNPAYPQFVRFIATGEDTAGIDIQYPYAYVAMGFNGLMVFDISVQTNPVLVDHITFTHLNDDLVTVYEYVRNVTLDGQHAYLASDTGGLKILDISNPSAVVLLSEYYPFPDLPGGGCADACRTYIYDVAVVGNRAYVVNFDLYVFDVSNPTNPILEDFFPLDRNGIYGWGFNVASANGHIFVAGDMGGFYAFDATQAPYLQIVDVMRTPGWSWDVDVEGNYAYMADDLSGFYVVDLSNPVAPTDVGHLDFPNWAMGVEVEGSLAYVAARESGLRIVDVTSPTAPVEIGSISTPNGARSSGLAVDGNIAYVTDNDSYLFVFDVTLPSAPSLLATLQLADLGNWEWVAQNIFVDGPYLYLAHNWNGVNVIDVLDPASPTITDRFCHHGIARDVWVEDGYAYAVGDFGLCIADVSYPSVPLEQGLFPIGSGISITVEDELAYVGTQTQIQVLSLHDPIHPTTAAVWDTQAAAYGPDFPHSLVVSNSTLYVAHGVVGLQIYGENAFYCGEIHVPTELPPVIIDGVVALDEGWDLALDLDMAQTVSPITLYLGAGREDDFLYIGIDDFNEDNPYEKTISLVFDLDNDGAWPDAPGREGMLRLAFDEEGGYGEFIPIYSEAGEPRLGESTRLPEGIESAMSVASGRLQAEWRIDLSEESFFGETVEEAFGFAAAVDYKRDIAGLFPGSVDRLKPDMFQTLIVAF